jgi:peptidyl-Lys metalloendopeptidase
VRLPKGDSGQLEEGKHMPILRRPLWLACLVVGLAVPSAAAAGTLTSPTRDINAGLVTAIQIAPAATADVAPTVQFTARNASSQSVDVLTWELPETRQSARILAVTRDGVPVTYHGRLVKHAPATEADYIRLTPGSSYTTSLDLAADYDLSLPGDYTVRLASTRVRVRPGRMAAATVEVQSGAGMFHTATGIQASVKTAHPRRTNSASSGSSAGLTNSGCSESQDSQLEQALAGAAQYTSNALSWLSENPSGEDDYETWFGTFDSTRFDHVNSTFSAMDSEFSNDTVTFDCTCDEPAYAFVNPDEPYNIHICLAFWDAPDEGYDSMAGTLVHESSHFTVNGSSDDHVYGIDEGKELAESDPEKAVTNADNLEHFAEGL